MFIQNKYKKWYDAIVASALLRSDKLEYSENHHILPRSLGGADDQANIVNLSAREHFICHALLTKFTSGVNRHKMLYAANMMLQIARSYQHRYIPNSKLYAMLKREFGRMHSERLTGRTLTADHRAKISASGKGRTVSAGTIEKRRLANTGKTRTAEQKERMRLAQLNRKEKSQEEKLAIAEKISSARKGKGTSPKSEEHKQKLSAIFKGKSNGVRTEETKQKMRKPKSEAHKKAISEGRKKKYQLLKQ